MNNNSHATEKLDFHIAALFTEDDLPKLFNLGDGSKVNNYTNKKLVVNHYYSTFLRAHVKVCS